MSISSLYHIIIDQRRIKKNVRIRGKGTTQPLFKMSLDRNENVSDYISPKMAKSRQYPDKELAVTTGNTCHRGVVSYTVGGLNPFNLTVRPSPITLCCISDDKFISVMILGIL